MSGGPPPDRPRRRAFLGTVGRALAGGALGLGAPLGLSLGAPPDARAGAGRAGPIRVGCAAWTFQSGFGPGIDPEPLVEQVGALGFDGVELLVNQAADLDALWTPDTVARVRRRLAAHRLAVVSLVLLEPVVLGLGSADAAARREAVDRFARGCRLARALGAGSVGLTSPIASETTYNGTPARLSQRYKLDAPRPGEKLGFAIAPEYDWARVWARTVAAVRECVAAARAHGLAVALEPHFHGVVAEMGSFLRLADAVPDPALRVVVDTGWAAMQGEYAPLLVEKARGRLAHVPVRDVDAQTRRFVPFGEGVVDLAAAVAALRRGAGGGAGGWLTFEEVFLPDARADAARFLAEARALLARG